VRPVLDELRLENRYAAAAEAAALHHQMRRAEADQAGWFSALREDAGFTSVAGDLVREQIRSGGWRPDVTIVRFADEAGFADVGDLLEELAAARSVRDLARAQLQALGSLFEEDAR
jgi:hypothetical protein